jgi:hypothetical protein
LPEFAAGVKDLSSGPRYSPSRAKYTENRAFSPQRCYIGGYDGLCFSGLRDQIRYLADQSNINGILPPNNEFKRPINRKTMEIPQAAKIRDCGRPPAIDTLPLTLPPGERQLRDLISDLTPRYHIGIGVRSRCRLSLSATSHRKLIERCGRARRGMDAAPKPRLG